MAFMSQTGALSTLAEGVADSMGRARGGGVEVDFDWTILAQIVLFLVLFVALKPMLFEPMLKLFEERERRIDGARKKARDIDNTSAVALQQYESGMARARAEGNAEREKLRAEGVAQENVLLGQVRAETVQKTEESRKRAQEELARVRSSLREELPKMSRELASRVLGREVA